MAGSTVFVTTDIALQGADLVSGGIVANVKKGVELMLLNNKYVADGPSVPGRGQCDVSALLRQGLDFLSKSPHEALGVPVGCRTPEIRKAYKKHALKYHPDKNPLTTPLFQVMSSAHDRLTDATQRHKEERTAAAKNPRPKPPPPAAPGPPPSGFPSGAAGGNTNSNGPNPTGNPHHPRPTYDPKSNKWSSEAEWGKFQQQPSAAEQSSKAQEAARRKQYYDEILREQFKKAESDRKAKEYAAMREAATRQRAGANANAAGTATGATAGASANSKPAEPNYYNYQNPNLKKPSTENTTSTESNGTGSANPHSRPPPYDYSSASAAGGAGTYAGRNQSFKPAAGVDTKVNPQNVPQYGKIPSREGPRDASKPSTAQRNSRGGERAEELHSSHRKNSAGIAGNGSDHGRSSSNLRNGGKSNASRVPRPYGLRCLFVGTNAAELEWVTSKYHRNSLLAELSWRIKESDPNASWRGTWESASKLISSGKCRKKNLQPGAIYEFRVRAVEELAGGLLGYRSDWSDTVVVTLLPDKTTYSSNNGPAAQPSPSQKSGHSASKRDLHGKEGAFSFTKADGKSADSQQAHPTPPPTQPPLQSQPTEPKQPKVHTYERFPTNSKPSEPVKINIYDQINAETKEKSSTPVGEGRKSTSSLPARSNVYDTSTASNANGTKAKAADTDTPLHEMTKTHVDSNVKRFPSRGLTGSGRNVWGPEAHNSGGADEPRVTTAKGKSKATKNDEKKHDGIAGPTSKDKNKSRDKGKEGEYASDGEIEEDIKDDTSAAREVDDEVNTVGVDEDSSSVHTTATKKGATSTAQSSERKGTAKKDSKKGEFADFTIEVEDGSEDEDEDSEVEDDDDFEVEYEEMYTLVAPPAKVKAAKKNSSSSNLGLYSHPVRSEPVPKSTIVGYLVQGTEVLACADAGNWLKVKIHKQPTRKVSMRNADDIIEWGWALRQDKNHEYLKLSKESLPPLHHPHVTGHKPATHESPAVKGSSGTFKSPGGSHYAPTTPLNDKSASTMGNPLGNRSMRALPKNPNHYTPPVGARLSFNEKNVPVWMELFDEGGHAYYFNEDTGESTWDPPNWVEEKDPNSGAKYYVNLGKASEDPSAPLYSTWTKPAEFARLLRT